MSGPLGTASSAPGKEINAGPAASATEALRKERREGDKPLLRRLPQRLQHQVDIRDVGRRGREAGLGNMGERALAIDDEPARVVLHPAPPTQTLAGDSVQGRGAACRIRQGGRKNQARLLRERALAPGEERSLSARLAAPGTFRLSGIPYKPILDDVQISIERRRGRTFLRLKTTQPLSEPALPLILELNTGRDLQLSQYNVVLPPESLQPPGVAVAGESLSHPAAMRRMTIATKPSVSMENRRIRR